MPGFGQTLTSPPLDPSRIFEAANEAHVALRDEVIQTPLLNSISADSLTGANIFMKADTLQRSGSFKYRGASNALRTLNLQQRCRGVVAVSSGNHAIAVSLAASRAMVKAAVVMPSDAPATKILLAKKFGARVVTYDRQNEDREEIADRLVKSEGFSLIPPFDDENVIAGAASGAIEAVSQLGATVPDVALIPCSGGGLGAGWVTVLRTLFPHIDIYVVEPVGFDDTGRSLATRTRTTNEKRSGSICDALLVPTPGRLTFPLLLQAGVKAVTVTDADVLATMRWCHEEMKLVVEPGGAAALAACLTQKVDIRGRKVLTILSGANVDAAMFLRAIGSPELQGADF